MGPCLQAKTDDVRCAPALEMIRRLLAGGARIRAYDPQAMDKARAQLPSVTYCRDPYEAADSASAVLGLTEWEEFHSIDWERVRRLVQRPLIFDARNMFSREKLTSGGFQYVGIGVASNSTVLDAVESTA